MTAQRGSGRREDPARDEAVLRDRALVLARPIAGTEHEDRLAVLGFTVAGNSYAIELSHIREVLASAEVSRVPRGHPSLAGVTNVRGTIVAVVDAGSLLRVSASSPGGPVIVIDGTPHLGLRVDGVDQVTSIPAHTLATPEAEAEGIPAGLVLGITSSVVVLNPRVLRDHPHLYNHQEYT